MTPSEPADGPSVWADAVSQALTGQPLEVTLERWEATAVADALLRAGWDAERLGQEAERAHADGRPWPQPPEPTLLRRLGAAAHQARVEQVRALLVRRPTRVRADRAPDERERALMRDVPPHFGPL